MFVNYQKKVKSVLPDVRFYVHNAPNSLSAGAAPQIQLGKLTALFHIPCQYLRGLLLRRGRGREEKGKEERRKDKGEGR